MVSAESLFPAFELHGSDGRFLRIWAEGRVDGDIAPANRCIINRIPRLMDEAAERAGSVRMTRVDASLATQLSRSIQENARLRKLLAKHGINPGGD